MKLTIIAVCLVVIFVVATATSVQDGDEELWISRRGIFKDMAKKVGGGFKKVGGGFKKAYHEVKDFGEDSIDAIKDVADDIKDFTVDLFTSTKKVVKEDFGKILKDVVAYIKKVDYSKAVDFLVSLIDSEVTNKICTRICDKGVAAVEKEFDIELDEAGSCPSLCKEALEDLEDLLDSEDEGDKKEN